MACATLLLCDEKRSRIPFRHEIGNLLLASELSEKENSPVPNVFATKSAPKWLHSRAQKGSVWQKIIQTHFLLAKFIMVNDLPDPGEITWSFPPTGLNLDDKQTGQ